MLTGLLEGYFSVKIGHDERIGHLCLEFRMQLKLGIAAEEVSDQLDCMKEGVVFRARLEHDLVAVAELSLILAGSGSEGAGSHHDACRCRNPFKGIVFDVRGSEILVGP